ncbi:MAG: choline/carnitine/betaine transporter [Desulfitibacter sp. BRH_c19]|nr:MAG: choline/carnitine/betaine transporter [Desulfitibacter sp. BRH_c19]
MDNSKNLKPEIAKINPTVFWGSVIVCLIFYVPMAIFQTEAQSIVNKLMSGITHNLDWMWLMTCTAAFIFIVWLAISRYGNVKLGGTDDKPEFSMFTWLAMLFFGGVGSSLVYWACLEPIWYLWYPPFGLEAFSAEAAGWSLAYGIFHWGFTPYALYTLAAIAFSYSYHVRKKPYLYPSYACRAVLGKAVDGWVGKAIDIFVVVGLVGGVGTALGVNIPMYSAIAADYLNVTDTMSLKIIFAVGLTSIFGYSAYRGLYGGIAKLSEICAKGIFLLIVYVLLVGPTFFSLSLFTENLGNLFNNVFKMNLYTDPIAKSGFPQDWTVFYWAWWIAWAIYMGLFIARVSKGRTIRQVISAVMLVGTAACSIFYLTFGSYIVDLTLNKGVAMNEILSEMGGPAVVVEVLNRLPLSVVVIPVFLVLMLIFQATSFDSNAYTMAMIGCYRIQGKQEPPKWSRFFWAGMLLFVAVALMLVGGLQVVQLSSVLTSVPVLFILIILAISLVKSLKEDFGGTPEDKMLVLDYKVEDDEPIVAYDENTSIKS